MHTPQSCVNRMAPFDSRSQSGSPLIPSIAFRSCSPGILPPHFLPPHLNLKCPAKKISGHSIQPEISHPNFALPSRRCPANLPSAYRFQPTGPTHGRSLSAWGRILPIRATEGCSHNSSLRILEKEVQGHSSHIPVLGDAARTVLPSVVRVHHERTLVWP